MENQIQLQLHHFCIINYNYVIGPGSAYGVHRTLYNFWWQYLATPVATPRDQL